jgi:hypothetical protein
MSQYLHSDALWQTKMCSALRPYKNYSPPLATPRPNRGAFYAALCTYVCKTEQHKNSFVNYMPFNKDAVFFYYSSYCTWRLLPSPVTILVKTHCHFVSNASIRCTSSAWSCKKNPCTYYCGGSWNEMRHGLLDLTTNLGCARREISGAEQCFAEACVWVKTLGVC